jgi:hypothetical protein
MLTLRIIGTAGSDSSGCPLTTWADVLRCLLLSLTNNFCAVQLVFFKQRAFVRTLRPVCSRDTDIFLIRQERS